MGIFQKSVIKNHLIQLDKEQVDKAFDKFKENYSPTKISEIKNLKEEEYQDGFLREIFVDIFGYTLKPAEDYNLAREFKNQSDGKKVDGAILKDGKAIVVIELKSTKTKDLKSITEQAFNYKNNQPDCKYVITSNFQKLRFYIDYANEYEEFDLFNLQKHEFELLYLILHKDSIFSDLPLKLKNETKFHEENISDKLYKDYSNYKHKIYNNLVKNNPQYDKLMLFKKSQKFLDRLLFVFFAEDTGLVPPNAISKIIEQWQMFKDNDEYFPLYSRFVKFFGHLNKGHKYPNDYELPAYNGGLFAPDEILDNVRIDDEILKDDTLLLSSYDFSTEVDVNILGHIFEHSLNEIEEITAEIEGIAEDKTKSKRKKDGVFYTPKYITQYIVENTVGKLCTEKRKELNITEIEFDGTYKTKDGKLSAKGKKLFKTLENYKKWLISLKIIDPACGSGAFLNQALSFLIEEHKQIDDIIAELTGEAMRLFDTDKAILENNLYGVDINEESVEIAKLSLWLRTAQKGRKLSNLNDNIKCGNSLIDDPEIAGDKAFHWQAEFPQIFTEKKKKAWHITTATHNSRYSQRMFDNNIKTGEAIWLDNENEIIITKTIAEIAKEDKLNLIEYNICGDHMHLLLICEEEELTKIVGKIKAVSGRRYNIEKGITIVPATSITRGHVPLSNTEEKKEKKKYNSLWTQKFGKSEIKNEDYLNNTIEYIRNNRIKHELSKSKEIENLKKEFLCPVEHAYRAEYNGGFDAVIGNPPYGATLDGREWLKIKYKETSFGNIDSYKYFVQLGTNLTKNNRVLGYIMPDSYLEKEYFKDLRIFVSNNFKSILNIKLGDSVFDDVNLPTAITLLSKKGNETNNFSFLDIADVKKENKAIALVNNPNYIIEKPNFEKTFVVTKSIIKNVKTSNLIDVYNQVMGVKVYQKGKGKPKQTAIEKENDVFVSTVSNKEFNYPFISQGINRYIYNSKNEYISYGEWLAEPRKLEYFDNPKIIIREIINPRIFATYIEEAAVVKNIAAVIIEKDENYPIKFLLGLINSKLFTYYVNEQSPKSSNKSYPSFNSRLLKELPIILCEQDEKLSIISNVDLILKGIKEREIKINHFVKRLTDNFEIDKITKKLDAFYDFDFKTLVSELKKKKVVLSLLQQDEWEEYFNAYKTEINNIQAQINQTDKEIDQMVYQLYELTEEEIEIVEESVN